MSELIGYIMIWVSMSIVMWFASMAKEDGKTERDFSNWECFYCSFITTGGIILLVKMFAYGVRLIWG